MAEAARVLVVDDEVAVRTAIEVAFRSEGFDVRGVADGTGMDALTADFRPDLAILDVRLPRGPDGYTMARALRRTSDLPVLMLTAADSLDDRLLGFDSGADDHLAKPFSTAELLARARALLRRAGRLGTEPLAAGDLVVDDDARTVTRAGQPVELTPTEYNVLVMLLRHRGMVLSRRQLLGPVRAGEALDPNVVEAHVSALRRKLEAHGPRLIHTVRGAGYLLRS